VDCKRPELGDSYTEQQLLFLWTAAAWMLKLTLDAAGASFKDVVHYFVFRARPRMGDIGKASGIINSYFAPFNHKPTSTNVAVLELGEPEQLIEIQMFAVVD
jgi:enamine deaminase RidA (YjgF/YER057c/UK114 family)